MTYTGKERRRMNKSLLVAIGAGIFVLIVISTASLVIADRATTTANRSEDGFCIAVKLVEDGAVADAAVANSPGVSPTVKRIRTQQYKASIAFAFRLRDLGFHCDPPSRKVIQLVTRKASR